MIIHWALKDFCKPMFALCVFGKQYSHLLYEYAMTEEHKIQRVNCHVGRMMTTEIAPILSLMHKSTKHNQPKSPKVIKTDEDFLKQ